MEKKEELLINALTVMEESPTSVVSSSGKTTQQSTLKALVTVYVAETGKAIKRIGCSRQFSDRRPF